MDRPDKGKLFLFKNDKYEKGGKLPSVSGNGEISREVLERFNKAMDQSSDGLIKLEVACWPKISKAGNSYTFGIMDIQNPEYAPKGETVDDDEEVPF
jgi:hypothetical protein